MCDLASDPQKMSEIDNVEDSSLHEDALLSEEHEDITGGTKSGSETGETITVSILQSLNQFNTNMAAMGESLKLLHHKGRGNSEPHNGRICQETKIPINKG